MSSETGAGVGEGETRCDDCTACREAGGVAGDTHGVPIGPLAMARSSPPTFGGTTLPWL
jgi:hypothetical protein